MLLEIRYALATYVGTSRALMAITGIVALAGGILLAPILAHGNPHVVTGYRIAFLSIDHGVYRGELHVLAAGPSASTVEHGAGEPAGPRLDSHNYTLAPQAALTGICRYLC